MKHPSTELKNPYYFLSTNDPKVIYEISEQQDKDGCGQHFVTYQTLNRTVNAGQSYLDLHGDRQQVTLSGTYPVSNGKLDIDACKEVFPYIEVIYKENKTSAETKSEYYWLDYLIQDDDTYQNGKFVMNTEHADVDDDFEGGYVAYYKQLVLEELGGLLTDHTIEDAKKSFPEFLFAEQGDKMTMNGKTVYFQEMTSSEESVEVNVSDEEINAAYYAYVCEQVRAYADRLVKKVDEEADASEVLPCLGANGGSEGGSEDDPDVPPTPPTPTTTYSLRLPARFANGHFENTGYTDANDIPAGTQITIKVVANSGYHFVNMMVNGVRVANNPYTFAIKNDTEIENVVIEQDSSQGETVSDEQIPGTIRLLSNSMDSLVASMDSTQNEIDNLYNSIDPINNEFLSESDLLSRSKVINACANTYRLMYESRYNETVDDEIMDEFSQDIVDYLITKQNPIYNYIRFADRAKTNTVSAGTFVINDFEGLADGRSDGAAYWEIKILGDQATNGETPNGTSEEVGEQIDNQLWNGNNGSVPRLNSRLENVGENSIVNNKYYILITDIAGLGSGASFELFVKENDELVSTGQFISTYVNTVLRRKNNPGQAGGLKFVVHETTYTRYPSLPAQAWDWLTNGGDYVVSIDEYVCTQYDARCAPTYMIRFTRITYHWHSGKTTSASFSYCI